MDLSTLLRDAILVVIAYLSGSIPVGVLVGRISGGGLPGVGESVYAFWSRTAMVPLADAGG